MALNHEDHREVGSGFPHGVYEKWKSFLRSANRRVQGLVFVGDKKFAVRQLNAHNHGNNRITHDIDAFLNQFSSPLDPPQYHNVALRRF